MWGTRIQGRTVSMRPITESELPLLLEWGADSEVLRSAEVDYQAIAPSELKKWWERAGTDPATFHWGLEHEGRLVGRTAILYLDWQMRMAWTATQLGDPTAWEQGIAAETMELRSEYAFRQLGLHKLDSACAEDSQGCREAHQRAGYREMARLKEQLYRDGRWHDEILTELVAEDWMRDHPTA